MADESMSKDCAPTSSPANGYRDVAVPVYPGNVFKKPSFATVPAFAWSDGCIDALAAGCMSDRGIVASAGMAGKVSSYRARCVYVISTPNMPVCKIGVAANPSQRLSQLQVGNWNRLYIAGLLWMVGESNELRIESLAHKAADEMDCWLSGEWVAMTPVDAMMLAVKAARFSRSDVADGERWLQGLALRTIAAGSAVPALKAA